LGVFCIASTTNIELFFEKLHTIEFIVQKNYCLENICRKRRCSNL